MSDEQTTRVDEKRLNDARWAACNTRFDDGSIPTMEKASEVATRAVLAYLGSDISEEEHELYNPDNEEAR